MKPVAALSKRHHKQHPRKDKNKATQREKKTRMETITGAHERRLWPRTRAQNKPRLSVAQGHTKQQIIHTTPPFQHHTTIYPLGQWFPNFFLSFPPASGSTRSEELVEKYRKMILWFKCKLTKSFFQESFPGVVHLLLP